MDRINRNGSSTEGKEIELLSSERQFDQITQLAQPNRMDGWYLWRDLMPEGIAFRSVFLKTFARLKQTRKVAKIERMLKHMEELVREYQVTWPALSESYKQDADKLRGLLKEIKREQVPSAQDGERASSQVLSQVSD